ncbi:MAG: SanA protein [uncultured Sulfurovum sp.]|uniref:SanA protein n=1 Tax=uncultured Sulfurovum sp. TaxID=269237 RepID=A0A6S6TXS4_9BACT|nr:MAG: SanA protein [uncultured Sulfurovum sp.]
MIIETKPYIYNDVQKIPMKRAALVLGCSKYLKNKRINYFFKYRMEAAAKLFHAGKVKAIVLSGDNGTKAYDETTAMYEDLMARGIPAKYLQRDYAGFRTLDSIVRAKAIFDLEDYIIVSQRFHLERAIYLAQAKGQKVLGFVAKDFKNTLWAKRMEHRELLARVKAVLDVNVFGTEPKFYGDKVKVHYK